MCSDIARANISLRALRYLSLIDETHSLFSSPSGLKEWAGSRMIVLLQASLNGVERTAIKRPLPSSDGIGGNVLSTAAPAKEFISRRTSLWWRNMNTAIQMASGAMGSITAISIATFIGNHGQTNFCRLLLSALRLEASQAHRRQRLE
jgi:hypothetical protein